MDIKKGGKNPHTPELRTEEMVMTAQAMPASFLTLSMPLSQKTAGWEGPSETLPFFMQHVGTVPMGISQALSRSLNSVGGEFLFSLNCSDLISICLKTGTNTQCDCKSSFT